VRKNDAGQLMFEPYKQSPASATTGGAAQVPQKQMVVKVAMLETTKKGRAILQGFSCIFLLENKSLKFFYILKYLKRKFIAFL
jgi:hypothetical protein